ncbi:MAG: hypothetical protein QG604_209 [Candidatus Dependentiae bacterium]|nr:hypothetical protein [Candidatus Dependentiae bacterium]
MCGVMHSEAPIMNAVDPETALLKVFAKYSAVFRLVPTRVSQILQVVNAYPASNPGRRIDLLQISIQRLHDKYRTIQQLQNRVLELQSQANPSGKAGVYARCGVLVDAIKKYQITLISILSVIDAEFVRSAKAAGGHMQDDGNKKDAAYLAAKSALQPTKMDVLISMLAAGESASEAEASANSVKSEIRQLRDEVSLLSAQLQAKALLDGGCGKSEKDFNEQMCSLNDESAQLLAKTGAAIGQDDEKIEVVATPKKYSLKSRRVQVQESTKPDTMLRTRALAFHATLMSMFTNAYAWMHAKACMVGDSIAAGWAWFVTLPVIADVYAVTGNAMGRVCTDTQKAAKHVEHRMKEVKEVAPEGVSLVKESLSGFFNWIVESWVKVGCYVLSFFSSFKEYWNVVQDKAHGVDESMRCFVCNFCEWFTNLGKSAIAMTLQLKARVLGESVSVPTEATHTEKVSKHKDSAAEGSTVSWIDTTNATVSQWTASASAKVIELWNICVATLMSLKSRVIGEAVVSTEKGDAYDKKHAGKEAEVATELSVTSVANTAWQKGKELGQWISDKVSDVKNKVWNSAPATEVVTETKEVKHENHTHGGEKSVVEAPQSLTDRALALKDAAVTMAYDYAARLKTFACQLNDRVYSNFVVVEKKEAADTSNA